MRNKIITMLTSVLLITGCHSSDSQSQSSAPPDEPNYSQSSVILSGEMIDFPVTDQASARSSIANTGSLLGINDVSTELGDCEESEIDGIHTYRFTRQHDGIPVFGTFVVLCAGSNGEVLQISGRPIDFDGISSEPKTGIEEVLSNLRSENNIDKDAVIFNDGLTFFINEQNQPILCYRLISDDTEWYECLTSADTGEILFQATPKTETVMCSGEDMQGKNREFPAEYENGTYYLRDYKRSIYMYDAGGETFTPSWVIIDSDNHVYRFLKPDSSGIPIKGKDENNNEVLFTFKDNKYTVYDATEHKIGHDAKMDLIFERYNASGKAIGSIKKATSAEQTWDNRPAVTLYVRLQSAYDFCKEVLNINSYDNQNGFIYGVYNDNMKGANNSRDPKNAYSVTLLQDSHIALKNFNITILSAGKDNSIAIDTIGHEFGHSIAKGTAKFNPEGGESGAIDEGIGDVFGELIEDWDDDKEMNGSNDWVLSGRNIADPNDSHCPSEYRGQNWFNTKDTYDNGGVHFNCTIISHAAYLMSIGSKQKNCTPLDNTDIAKLFYHTLKDNALPTDVGMIEFSEKMINTACMLATQSVLDWDKVTTVVQSLSDVGLSDSSIALSLLKPDFEIEVLDPNEKLYDDYHVEIFTCNDWSTFQSAFYLKHINGNDEYSLENEFDVKTHEMPHVHLSDGVYIIRITDNQTKEDIHTFSVTVSESKGVLAKLSAQTEMFASEQPDGQPVDRPDDLTDFAGAEYYPVNIADIPAGLKTFLHVFTWETTYGESGNAVLGSREYDVFDGRDAWILPWVLQRINYSEYPITARSRLYEYVDEEDMDWILMNIYNLPSDSIDRYKRDATPNNYNNGKYYLWGAYAGPAPSATNIQPAFNGKYYYVSYDIEWSYPGQIEHFIYDPKHYALMEYKIIDGKGYWSIYKDTVDSNALAALGIN